MKIMNELKKFGSKVVEVVVSAKDKALGLLAVGTAVLVGSTPAKADLATDLGTITTAATDGVSTVGTSQATVIVSVFGLVLLSVGAGWLFRSLKSR
jgi:hypothetical protein